MNTLHLGFDDLPQYSNGAAAVHNHEPINTMNETGALGEQDSVIDGESTPSVKTSLTLQTDINKGTPPSKQSPGASSVQSISPIPQYERNMNFFQQLSRRFGLLRSSDDPVYNAAAAADDDSTDSCSSTTAAMLLLSMPRLTGASNCTSSFCEPNMAHSENNTYNNNNKDNTNSIYLQTNITATMKDGQDTSSEHISCTSSETSSTVDIDEAQEQQQQQNPTRSPIPATDKCAINKERRSSACPSFSRLHRRSTSSLRRAFGNFSLSSRSLSSSGNTAQPPSSSNKITSTSTQHTPQHMDVGSNNMTIKSSLKYSSNIELNRKLLDGGGIGSGMSVSGSTTSSATSKSSKSKTKPPPQRILRQPISYTYLKGISGLPTQRVPRSAVCCQYARR